MKTFRLVWSPEGKEIARVQAKTMREAKRKAPLPYRKYLGEIYAEELVGGKTHDEIVFGQPFQ